ncbi:hypothetical protein [Streptomyces sp. NPDC005732]|uniref:hypothetical protein n=1 Tax=Streptomyces sp. NPDC005732 TaxID=3157057 RepID=UPI00340E8D6F
MTDRTWRGASDGTGRTASTLTAPLPPAAASALASLEGKFVPVSLDVARAVARYEAASARYDELAARPASMLSPAEVDAFSDAGQTVAESLVVLADHARLDLIAPAESAARYRKAAEHCRRLAAVADYEGCEYVRDEMAMCRCELAKAGRLDLIGAA